MTLCQRSPLPLLAGDVYTSQIAQVLFVLTVVDNVYMEMFEGLTIKTKLAPRIWKRYVDDTSV